MTDLKQIKQQTDKLIPFETYIKEKGITRTYAYTLIKDKKIDSFKIGWSLFIIDNEKSQKYTKKRHISK